MPIARNTQLLSGLNGTANRKSQLPKRGRYGQKNKSARRQWINRHAASQSPQRETLRKGHRQCVVRA
jgi:hypothetical protein